MEYRIVIVKFDNCQKNYIYQCQSYELSNGSRALVEVDGVEKECTVVKVLHYYDWNKNELDTLLLVANAKLPLKKIKGMVERTYFEDDEEQENED